MRFLLNSGYKLDSVRFDFWAMSRDQLIRAGVRKTRSGQRAVHEMPHGPLLFLPCGKDNRSFPGSDRLKKP